MSEKTKNRERGERDMDRGGDNDRLGDRELCLAEDRVKFQNL